LLQELDSDVSENKQELIVFGYGVLAVHGYMENGKPVQVPFVK
jgi:hypothetical protein